MVSISFRGTVPVYAAQGQPARKTEKAAPAGQKGEIFLKMQRKGGVERIHNRMK